MAGNGEMKTPYSQEAVRLEMDRTREQIASSAAGLRHEVALRTDWRVWVRERPLVFVAGAFAVGFLLGNRR